MKKTGSFRYIGDIYYQGHIGIFINHDQGCQTKQPVFHGKDYQVVVSKYFLFSPLFGEMIQFD